MLNYLRRLSSVRPLIFFLITGAIFGLFFIVVTPPFEGTDEDVHFYRAYQISEGNLVADTQDGVVGGSLPKATGQIIHISNETVIRHQPNIKYNLHSTKAALAIHPSSQRKFYDFFATTQYSPIPYLPASVAILIARLLHLPTLLTLYAARVANLALWLALIGGAIALIPRRKWAMAATGLLPMALFQASTLNGDPMTMGTLALLLAYVLQQRDEAKKISYQAYLILLVTAIFMALSKQIMFVFLPITLLIPRECFSSLRASRFWRAVLVVVPLLCFVGWLLVSQHINITDSVSNGQDPPAQLRFILHSPQSFINVLWNTYFFTWGDGITRSFIGTFGWADTPLSELITTAGYIGLVLILCASDGTYKAWLGKKVKTLLMSLVVVYVLAVSASLYLFYTPVAFKIIVGLQGRYYLPLAFMAVVVSYGGWLKMTRSNYRRLVMWAPVLLLLCSGITIVFRFYINNV